TLVTMRAQQQDRYRELVPPPRFETDGPPYWGGQLERAGWERTQSPSQAATGVILRGIPCGRGVVEGSIRIVTEPADVGGGIIAAYRPDPGWVSVRPSASGLLIERGSPLTHLAIVARELGVPTIVQIPGLIQQVTTGMRVRMDGATGEVTILA